jgi:CheY-like chemotaxis protein
VDARADAVVDILVVDDDPGDALLVQEAFAWPHSGLPRRAHIASDGGQALRFVRRSGEYTDAPRPRLILLDLNLNGLNGLEVLAELKTDETLMTIPVVVLSSSRHPTDIQRSYALHANVYVVKPVDLDEFGAVIRSIDSCFLRVAEPAPEGQHDREHPAMDR